MRVVLLPVCCAVACVLCCCLCVVLLPVCCAVACVLCCCLCVVLLPVQCGVSDRPAAQLLYSFNLVSSALVSYYAAILNLASASRPVHNNRRVKAAKKHKEWDVVLRRVCRSLRARTEHCASIRY